MLDDLSRDYRAMSGMIFGEAPAFEEIIDDIIELEAALNAPTEGLKKAMARNMAEKTKGPKPRRNPKPTSKPAKVASRAGSNAGRGFRYQDVISAWLSVEIWAGQRAPAIVIPEGGDDIELRSEATSFVQVKSRREHLGDYTEGRGGRTH